jgi:hypothetical protein
MPEHAGPHPHHIIESAEGDHHAPTQVVDRRERILELVATAILAVATVATAWSGYQATRWAGVQARSYLNASGLRIQADELYTEAGQNKAFDSQEFSQWLNAYASGNTALADIYQKRFRPEFLPAFNAWLATDPFHNPAAATGPLFMPQYQSAALAQSAVLQQQAAAAVEAGQEANETSDQYVLNTVFLASALFLAGIAGRFAWRPARITILITSGIVLGLGLVNVIRLPVH